MRDQLHKNCSNSVLRKLLEVNNYNTTGGENSVRTSLFLYIYIYFFVC